MPHPSDICKFDRKYLFDEKKRQHSTMMLPLEARIGTSSMYELLYQQQQQQQHDQCNQAAPFVKQASTEKEQDERKPIRTRNTYKTTDNNHQSFMSVPLLTSTCCSFCWAPTRYLDIVNDSKTSTLIEWTKLKTTCTSLCSYATRFDKKKKEKRKRKKIEMKMAMDMDMKKNGHSSNNEQSEKLKPKQENQNENHREHNDVDKSPIELRPIHAMSLLFVVVVATIISSIVGTSNVSCFLMDGTGNNNNQNQAEPGLMFMMMSTSNHMMRSPNANHSLHQDHGQQTAAAAAARERDFNNNDNNNNQRIVSTQPQSSSLISPLQMSTSSSSAFKSHIDAKQLATSDVRDQTQFVPPPHQSAPSQTLAESQSATSVAVQAQPEQMKQQQQQPATTTSNTTLTATTTTTTTTASATGEFLALVKSTNHISQRQQQQHQQQNSKQQQVTSDNGKSNNFTNTLNQSRLPHLNKLWPGQQQRDLAEHKTMYACEGEKLELSCAEGKLIHLVRASYGRFSMRPCNEFGHSNLSTVCAAFRAFLIMQPKCNQQSNCNVTVSNEIFGDPCPGTSKYLEVQYYCNEANPSSLGSPRFGQQNTHRHELSQGNQQRIQLANQAQQSEKDNSNANQDLCPSQISSRGLVWNATRAGQVASLNCPDGWSGQATWFCHPKSLLFWPQFSPDFSSCRSTWLAKIQFQVQRLLDDPSANFERVLSTLSELNLLAGSRPVYAQDLKMLESMLSRLLSMARSFATLIEQQKQVNVYAENFFRRLVELVSNLFDWNKQKLAWLQLNSLEVRKIESKLLEHVQEGGLLLASSTLGQHEHEEELANLHVNKVHLPSSDIRAVLLRVPRSFLSNSIEQQQEELERASTQIAHLLASSNTAQSWSLEFKLDANTLRQQQHRIEHGPSSISNFNSNSDSDSNLVLFLVDVSKPDFLWERAQLESKPALTTINEPSEERVFGLFSTHSQLDHLHEHVHWSAGQTWPLNVLFRSTHDSSARVAPESRHCRLMGKQENDARQTKSCQTIRSHESGSLLCRCDTFGFVTLEQAHSLQQDFKSQDSNPSNEHLLLLHSQLPSRERAPILTQEQQIQMGTIQTHTQLTSNQANSTNNIKSILALASILVLLLVLAFFGLARVPTHWRRLSAANKIKIKLHNNNNNNNNPSSPCNNNLNPILDHPSAAFVVRQQQQQQQQQQQHHHEQNQVNSGSITSSSVVCGLAPQSSLYSLGPHSHLLNTNQHQQHLELAFSSGHQQAAIELNKPKKPFRWLWLALSRQKQHDKQYNYIDQGKVSLEQQQQLRASAIGAAVAQFSAKSHFANGYSSTLHAHNNIQHHRMPASVAPQANSSNSTSSYVSSSAYYEEIGLTGSSSQQLVPNKHQRTVVDLQQPQPQLQLQQAHQQQQNLLLHQASDSNSSACSSYAWPLTIEQQQQLANRAKVSSANINNPSYVRSSLVDLKSDELGAGRSKSMTTRHLLFASPSAVNAYMQRPTAFH